MSTPRDVVIAASAAILADDVDHVTFCPSRRASRGFAHRARRDADASGNPQIPDLYAIDVMTAHRGPLSALVLFGTDHVQGPAPALLLSGMRSRDVTNGMWTTPRNMRLAARMSAHDGLVETAISDSATLARLILRAVAGGTMIAHGVRHARSLDGTARWFGSIGFRHPELQAKTSALMEIGTGSALVAGAATPASAAAVIGTMAVAGRTVHMRNGFFVVDEGWEYVAFIGSAVTALSALGAGRFSVDRLLGLDKIGTPASRAAFSLGLGLTGAALQLLAFWRSQKHEEPAEA
jgi:putative oxidoreductase